MQTSYKAWQGICWVCFNLKRKKIKTYLKITRGIKAEDQVVVVESWGGKKEDEIVVYIHTDAQSTFLDGVYRRLVNMSY